MGETFQYFEEQTKADVLQRLSQLRAEGAGILSEISVTEKLYNQAYQKQQYAFWQMKKRTAESSLARQQLIQAQYNFGMVQAYIKGYKFLNKVGHYFNGEWGYSVNLPDGGRMITFHLSEEEFLELGEVHLSDGGSFRLASTSSILQKMKDSQIKGTYWDEVKDDERYNQTNYNNYVNAIDYAKKIASNAREPVAIANYNRGQVLEGYFAYAEQNTNISSMLEDLSNRVNLARGHHLGNRYRQLHKDLQELANDLKEQTNSRGFWSGGDTEEEGQIKGEGASIFQFSTIKRQLSQFLQITNNLNFTGLKNALNNQVKPEARKSLENKVQKILEETMGAFNATNLSLSTLGNINSLKSDINVLIEELI